MNRAINKFRGQTNRTWPSERDTLPQRPKHAKLKESNYERNMAYLIQKKKNSQ